MQAESPEARIDGPIPPEWRKVRLKRQKRRDDGNEQLWWAVGINGQCIPKEKIGRVQNDRLPLDDWKYAPEVRLRDPVRPAVPPEPKDWLVRVNGELVPIALSICRECGRAFSELLLNDHQRRCSECRWESTMLLAYELQGAGIELGATNNNSANYETEMESRRRLHGEARASVQQDTQYTSNRANQYRQRQYKL
jgi:hypothetical protein